MKTVIISILSSLLGLMLAGCSTSSAPLTLAERYQQLLHDSDFSVYAMRSIAAEAYQQGDLALMSDAQWTLCQRAVSQGGNSEDCAALLDVAIIQHDMLTQAKAYLAQYFLTRNDTFYQQAMALLPQGESDLQALLDPSVDDCLTASQQTEWLALRCYLSGKLAGNEKALSKALKLFEQFDARHNMADSYFVLAKLKLAQGRATEAADYASKAALLLTQLGEAEKADLVRHWRWENVYVQ